MSDDFAIPERSILFADECRGIYIPQHFAEAIERDLVTGVSDEDYAILEAGPDHEYYWETWDDVCNNAVIKHSQWGDCYLYQDGCLWIIAIHQPD